jgi:hypothetical protein
VAWLSQLLPTLSLRVSNTAARLCASGWTSILVALFLIVNVQAVMRASADVPLQGQPRAIFDIPAQSLSDALSVFAQVSGMNVLYDAEQVVHVRSAEIKGERDRIHALGALLDGSGLQPRYLGPNTVRIARVSGSAASPEVGLNPLRVSAAVVLAPPDRAAFIRFGLLVQTQVRRTLEINPNLNDRLYSGVVRVWFDASGKVSSVEVLVATPDEETHAAMNRALSDIDIGHAAPAGMPQPVNIRVQAHAAH